LKKILLVVLRQNGRVAGGVPKQVTGGIILRFCANLIAVHGQFFVYFQ
jgi:hypothetical protein